MLVAAGYEVTGTTRSAERAASISATGAQVAVVDVLDDPALTAVVMACRPDVVIHQVTDLATKPAESLTTDQLARNAHLRAAGTRNLVEAAVAAGAHRVIAQSIAWLFIPGSEPHTEEETIVPADPNAIDDTRRGVIELERLVTADSRIEGVVLRYGRLYGPGTWTATPAEPPTVHVEAAAGAAVLAVRNGTSGIFHVVDDDGPVSNAKARSVLGWEPTDGQGPRVSLPG
jgi:nucleoside-diphosphate-sugar epimerase